MLIDVHSGPHDITARRNIVKKIEKRVFQPVKLMR